MASLGSYSLNKCLYLSICSQIVEIILEEYLLKMQVKTGILFDLLFFRSLVGFNKTYLLASHIAYFENLFLISFAYLDIILLFIFVVISV